MSYNHGTGITRVEVFKQCAHGSLLCRRAGVVGLTADIQPTLIADANRMGVVVQAVRAYQPFWTAWLYCSVSSDYVVVADTQLPVVILAMPRIYLSGRTGLVGPHRRTMDDDQCDGSHNYMQAWTKNVVITSVINDPTNFKTFPILLRLNFIRLHSI